MKISSRKTGTSKSTKRTASFVDRADPYVDSRLMTHRVRCKQNLSARIQGNYGVYRTWARIGNKAADSGCTCPSDWWPCKHVTALKRTWRGNPRSFFDVDAFLKTLAGRPKAELIATIGKLISRAPEGLSALGVKGFEEVDLDDTEDENI